MNLTRRDALSLGLLGTIALSVTCVKISDTKNPGFMPPATPPPAPTTRSRSARRTRPSRRPAPCSRLSGGAPAVVAGPYEAGHGGPRLLAPGLVGVAVVAHALPRLLGCLSIYDSWVLNLGARVRKNDTGQGACIRAWGKGGPTLSETRIVGCWSRFAEVGTLGS